MFAIRILRLIKRELTDVVLSDWRLTIMIFIMPVAYTALLGFLYMEKRVSEVPVMIIDHDNGALSRSIATAVDRSDAMRVVGMASGMDEVREAVLSRKAYAAIWIPPDFERDIKKGKQAKLLTVADGSNMMLSNTVVAAMARVAGTFSAAVEMKTLNMKGAPSDHLQNKAMPIDGATRVWYNPTYNYNTFVMVGLISVIVQQITLVGCALAFARERQHGLLPQILKITDSPLEVLAAKGIFYTVVNLITALAAFWMSLKYFGINFYGSAWLFFMMLTVFIIAIVGLGICASAILGDELFATEALMLVSLPSFLLSGFTWPDFAMLPGIKFISWILPLTHFIMPLRTVFMQGGGFEHIRSDMLWLWTLAAASYLIAYVVIWRSMANARVKLEKEPSVRYALVPN